MVLMEIDGPRRAIRCKFGGRRRTREWLGGSSRRKANVIK
jgi:hypothetical protein